MMRNHSEWTGNAELKHLAKIASAVLLAATLFLGVMAAPLMAQSAQGQTQAAQPPTAQSKISDWQTAAGTKMAFDVASIKLDKTGGEICTHVAFSCALDLGKPALVRVVNQPLRELIAAAYHLTPWQVRALSGIPEGMDSERFDIEATADGNAGIEQKRIMLQSLLADRFKLTLHHETRKEPVFALVLGPVIN